MLLHPAYNGENISGPRNYGKSIEWKLEGDPWVSEGLYSDSTRGVYLLCLILQVDTYVYIIKHIKLKS